MHCLVVTILCCVDDHFTSFVCCFVVVDHGLTVNFVMSYVQYLGKTDTRSAIDIGFFSVINKY